MPPALTTKECDELLKLAGRLKSGKQIATDRYLHFENPEAGVILAILSRALHVPDDANVLRISRAQVAFTISFSLYENFFDDPFPKLVWSEHHDLATGAVTKRSEGKNPAILHRKELLLSNEDPRRNLYAGLTQALIEKGLLPTREFIGRHDHWCRYLTRNGFTICNDGLSPLGDG